MLGNLTKTAPGRAPPRPVPRSPALSLVGALHGTTRVLVHRLRPELRAVGLTECHFWTLNRLSATGPSSSGALAEDLDVRLPSLTAVVDQLAEHGFLTRRRSSRDRRIVVNDLTPKGRRTLEALWGRIGSMVDAASKDLARRDLETASRVLGSIAGELLAESDRGVPPLSRRTP